MSEIELRGQYNPGHPAHAAVREWGWQIEYRAFCPSDWYLVPGPGAQPAPKERVLSKCWGSGDPDLMRTVLHEDRDSGGFGQPWDAGRAVEAALSGTHAPELVRAAVDNILSEPGHALVDGQPLSDTLLGAVLSAAQQSPHAMVREVAAAYPLAPGWVPLLTDPKKWVREAAQDAAIKVWKKGHPLPILQWVDAEGRETVFGVKERFLYPGCSEPDYAEPLPALEAAWRAEAPLLTGDEELDAWVATEAAKVERAKSARSARSRTDWGYDRGENAMGDSMFFSR